MTKSLIVKDNKFIEAKYFLTLTEVKVFSKLVSMNYRESSEFLEYEISIKQLLEDLKMHKKNHKEIKEAVEKLLTRIITLDTENELQEEIETKLQLLAKASLNKKTLTYTFKIHSDLKEYLLQLRNNFTQYELENILKLKSFYSFRMYEMMKMNEFKKVIIYSIDELKKHLDIGKDQYQMYSAFKKYVLEKTQKDVKEFTDISFTFEAIKPSRKIEAIKFKIKKNKETTNDKLFETYSKEVLELYKLLPLKEQTESRKQTLKKLLEEHSINYLILDIKYCKKKKAEDFWGYLYNSVRNGHYGKDFFNNSNKKDKLIIEENEEMTLEERNNIGIKKSREIREKLKNQFDV